MQEDQDVGFLFRLTPYTTQLVMSDAVYMYVKIPYGCNYVS